jgi:hypothetical protein
MWESRFLESAPRPTMGRAARAVAAGLTGVATVTALNEGARRVWRDAPRIEALGERAMGRLARRAGYRLRKRDTYWLALAASTLFDGAYFALAGLGRRPRLGVGAALGALAGAGAVLLPERLGLGARPTRRTPETALATFGWYVAAGLAAAAVGRARARSRERALATGGR